MNFSSYTRRIEIAFWTTLITAMRSPRFARVGMQCLSVTACVLLLWAVVAWADIPTTGGSLAAAEASASQVSGTALGAEPRGLQPANGQSNLLLILVDRLSSDHPRLEGVWLVARMPLLPQATFLPIYPSASADSAFDNRLAKSFSLKDGRQPGAEFGEALRAQGLWWNHHLILDASGLATLTEGVPGIDESIVAARQVEEAGGEPMAIEHQAQIAAAICEHAFSGSGSSAADAAAALVEWARTDLSADQLRQAARDFNAAGGLTCQFPTLAGR